MTLGLEPPRDGIMSDPPRRRTHFFAGALPKAVDVRHHHGGRHAGAGQLRAAARRYLGVDFGLRTFVLFQFFNVFNARTEQGTTFNRQFFRNGKLWAALGAVLALQVLVVHWPPAKAVFDTTALSMLDWGLAFLVASSILWLDEAQKLGAILLQRSQRSNSRVNTKPL